MRQNRVHLMPPMSNFYARICVKATPSSNTFPIRLFESPSGKAALRALSATDVISRQPPDLP